MADSSQRDFNADQINQSKLINHYNTQPELVTVHYDEICRLKLELLLAQQQVEEIEAERVIACEKMKELGVLEIVLTAIAITKYEQHVGFKFQTSNSTYQESEREAQDPDKDLSSWAKSLHIHPFRGSKNAF